MNESMMNAIGSLPSEGKKTRLVFVSQRWLNQYDPIPQAGK